MSNTKITSIFRQKRLKLILVLPLTIFKGFYARKINKLDQKVHKTLQKHMKLNKSDSLLYFLNEFRTFLYDKFFLVLHKKQPSDVLYTYTETLCITVCK